MQQLERSYLIPKTFWSKSLQNILILVRSLMRQIQLVHQHLKTAVTIKVQKLKESQFINSTDQCMPLYLPNAWVVYLFLMFKIHLRQIS